MGFQLCLSGIKAAVVTHHPTFGEQSVVTQVTLCYVKLALMGSFYTSSVPPVFAPEAASV